MRKPLYTVAVYLNRDCVLNCPQCGICDGSKRPLSSEKFQEAFDILHETLGVTFFLVLGTEPLLLKDTFVDIVKYWSDRNLFYAIYSISPEPLFTRYRNKLLDVGLNNWSCGIDGIPGLHPLSPIVEKKTKMGLKGLKWMSEHGVDTFEVTTVTNENLDHVADIVEFCQENIRGCGSCINPVEWRHNDEFDFFSKKEDMLDLVIPPERLENVHAMVRKMLELTRRPGYIIQNNDKFLKNYHKYYDTLDLVCGGTVGMGMDCSGELRRCGYSKGKEICNYTVWDLAKDPDKIYDIWLKDAQECKGCYWSWIYSLQEDVNAAVLNSDYYRKRWGAE